MARTHKLQEYLEKIVSLVNERKSIKYVEVAVELGISPNYARVLMQMVATKYPDRYRYITGTLEVKK